MKNLFVYPAILVGVAAAAAFAQGPASDTVMVTFDRPVQVGSQTLPAGEYTIRQITSASNPRVLEFTSDHGTKLDATVTAIPILQNSAPSQTKIELQDEGGGARLARIWVQGKNYGYAFPGEAAPAKPTPSTSARLEGTFAPTPARQEPAVVAQNTQPAPQPQAAAPAPAPEPAPQPQAQPAPEPSAPAADNPDVPATGLGWAEYVAAGLFAAVTGLFLYWRTDRRMA